MTTTHGMTRIAGRDSPRSPTYVTWQRMKSRCQNPQSVDYARYGGRGIKVCESWLSFASFLADMGERPKGLQLDRIDNEGGYEPSNCRWVTKQHNARNRSSNRLIAVHGVTRLMTEWAEISGLGEAFRSRINAGWTPERAFTTPINRSLSRKRA